MLLSKPRMIENRLVRLLSFRCPKCGKPSKILVTSGEKFSFDVTDTKTGSKRSFNVRHYNAIGNKIYVTPGVSFGMDPVTKKPVPPHRKNCSFYITGEEFLYEPTSSGHE